ncbi:MAG: hypothetical protein JO048_11500 [Methylobacteriaceae bacterium]|nr:hypothetical protein [Methylobacteriaceae bacterium]
MTSLDARALATDPDGLAFLTGVLGTPVAAPCVQDRFGVSPRAAMGGKHRGRKVALASTETAAPIRPAAPAVA